MATKNLLKKWEKNLQMIVNPDNFSWQDIGYDEKPEEYETVEEALMAEGEFDEGQQTSLALISEFLEDLKSIK